jgi:hypothetical protein
MPLQAPALLAPDIRFEIGEIVLHGLPRLNRYDLAEGVHAELTQSLLTHGLPSHFRGLDRVNRVDGRQITFDGGARPGQVGQQIAGAILGGAGQ